MKQLNPYIDAIDTIGGAIDKAMVIAVDNQSPDVLLARLAEAHAGIIRADMMLHAIDVEPATHNGRLPEGAVPKDLPPRRQEFEAKALPKVQKQPKPKHQDTARPGIAKLLRSAKSYDCPTCKAEPGTRCFEMTGPGKLGTVTDKRRDNDWMHRSRVQLATDHNNAVRAKYDKEHYQS